MRYRLLLKGFLSLCVFITVSILIFIAYERSRYNLISNKEIKEIHQKLSTLSEQEKKDLAAFFEDAILLCNYPYTLVGYKPMSISIFLQESDDLPTILREDYERPCHRNYADALERGHRTWEKYQFLFPLKHYLLIRCCTSDSKGINKVALIDPNLCLSKIQEHLDDFCEILGKPYESEDILEILTHPSDENFYKVTEHHQLLGILLGYGRNNAYLFQNNKRDKMDDFSNEWPPIWPKKWLLPSFLSDNTTKESQDLKKSYEEARRYIRWTYFNRNDLEVTLALLSKG